MATDRAIRAPLPHKLDEYVASIQKLFGDPETVPDSAFINKGRILIPGVGSGAGSYVVSSPIGFDIEFNGKTYKYFSVSDAGWMFLRDPAGGSTGEGGGSWFYYDVIYNPSAPPNQASIYSNEFILPNFAYDHILFAPWFGTDLQQTTTTIDQLRAGAYSGIITDAIETQIIQGANTKNWPYDSVDNGVRCLNGFDSKKGKYLLVRWTMASNYYTYKFKFEVAIYENGLVEYRYWPLEYYEPTSTAFTPSIEVTVGGFWSGASSGANKFRDLSPLLDYKKDERNISLLGGATYINSFTEAKTTAYRNAPYAVKVPVSRWPKNGAVISLAPPVKSVKFLPRKLTTIISSNKEIVRSPGRFDDRKSIAFKTGSLLNLPSGLPNRLYGDTGDVNVSLQQLLFTSGSIITTGSINKAVFDSNVEQINTLDSLVRSTDFSFNESQKNYDTTSEVTGFYATGSSLELFGEGFTSPLKSKTHFNFSLPVTKKTTMPSITASLYYYDAAQKQWIMPNPRELQDPFPTLVDGTDVENGITIVNQVSSFDEGIYRVTENGRGFDAVGRKIVSGTNTYGYQSDNSIGAIYNITSSVSGGTRTSDGVAANASFDLLDNAISKSYSKTLVKNANYFPSASQTIPFQTDYPFLIEKITVDIPLYIEGDWFKDLTTCNKAFGNAGVAAGFTSGAIDFGGPGLTFSLLCPRRGQSSTYLDIIASGTITHTADATGSVVLYKNSGMNHYVMRPVGFYAFSNPSTIISGTNNIFDGKVRLELEASVAGGLTIARNDISVTTASLSTRTNAIQLLTAPQLFTKSDIPYNTYSHFTSPYLYQKRSPRIYIQQVSPLSRGTTGIEFNGNSILGGAIANYNEESIIDNPLYYAASESLLANEFTTKIDSANFSFDSIFVKSLVDSRPSPYLMLPGDKLTLAFSKTRPVIYKMFETDSGGNWSRYGTYQFTGSHGTVALNTGSIDITVYGSYIR